MEKTVNAGDESETQVLDLEPQLARDGVGLVSGQTLLTIRDGWNNLEKM